MKALEQYLIPTIKAFVREKEGNGFEENVAFDEKYVTRQNCKLSAKTKSACRKLFTILHNDGLSEAEKALIMMHSCRRGMNKLNIFWWGMHRSWVLRWATGNIDEHLLLDVVSNALDNWTVRIKDCIAEREKLIQEKLKQYLEDDEKAPGPKSKKGPDPDSKSEKIKKKMAQAIPAPQRSGKPVPAEDEEDKYESEVKTPSESPSAANQKSGAALLPRQVQVVGSGYDHKSEDPKDDKIAQLEQEVARLTSENQGLRDIIDEMQELSHDKDLQITLLSKQPPDIDLTEKTLVFKEVERDGQLKFN